MKKFGGWLFLILLVFLTPGAARSQEVPVDVELVLAVDVSYSISEAEFALQMAGIASAFRNPSFLASLKSAAPRGIAVSLVQWAGDAARMIMHQDQRRRPIPTSFLASRHHATRLRRHS